MFPLGEGVMGNSSSVSFRLKRYLRGPRGFLYAMSCFYILIVSSYGSYITLTDYDETLNSSEKLTRDYVRLLEEHSKRTLDSTDLLVLRLMDRLAVQGRLPLPSEYEAERRVMSSMANASPQTETLFLVDPIGRVILSSRPLPQQGLDVSERDFFSILKQGHESLFIGRVVRDPFTNNFTFPVARRVIDAQGRFLGIVVASISNIYFKEFYHNLAVGSTPALGVYKIDGSILVREPIFKDDDVINRNMATNPIYVKYLPQSPIGTYRGKSAYDGVQRVVSYRKVENPPLLVWMSIAENDALAEWRWRAWRNAGIGVLTILIMAGLSMLVLRAVRHEETAREDLERANDSLRRSNADLEQFAYIASHDLQEPLRQIGSYVQLLERRYKDKLDNDANTFITYTVDGVKRLQSLIHELLAYSSVGTRRSPFTETDLTELARKAVLSLSGDIKSSGAEVLIETLPTLTVDAPQIEAVFQQLVSNGLRFQAKGTVPRLRIWSEERADDWVVSIKDNGIGIDSQYFDRIFLIFKRLHSRAEYPGDGIGLALCQRVVERHGGRIWVESEPGQGAVFRFTLPKVIHQPAIPGTP
ncbi:MAG: sensor histidine kinase [Rhodospirillales bacterium]|nr:MAG: sensor histidine kinase [Rhodospirillales bacterium]